MKRFFRRVLGRSHVAYPRVITVYRNAAYPGAIADLQAEQEIKQTSDYRASEYLHSLIELDHPSSNEGAIRDTLRRPDAHYKAMK